MKTIHKHKLRKYYTTYQSIKRMKTLFGIHKYVPNTRCVFFFSHLVRIFPSIVADILGKSSYRYLQTFHFLEWPSMHWTPINLLNNLFVLSISLYFINGEFSNFLVTNIRNWQYKRKKKWDSQIDLSWWLMSMYIYIYKI